MAMTRALLRLQAHSQSPEDVLSRGCGAFGGPVRPPCPLAVGTASDTIGQFSLADRRGPRNPIGGPSGPSGRGRARGPGSVGDGGQEEAVRLGVARVLEGGGVGGLGRQPGRRAGPHDARLELGLVQRRDACRAAARVRRQDVGDVGGVGASRHHRPLVELVRRHAGRRKRGAGLDLLALQQEPAG